MVEKTPEKPLPARQHSLNKVPLASSRFLDYPKHIVVIGGGLAGLAAAYDLSRKGFRVTLVEEQDDFGGLASSISMEGQSVERFYHFICRGDDDLIDLVHELGLGDKLHWRQTSTAFFSHQRVYRFGTPFDLLRFDCIPWLQRLRFGVHILSSRFRSQWKWLDQIPAKPWLIENIGLEAYTEIWHPLLKVKFGDYYEKISAAWIWHRIWRVAKSRKNLFSHETFGYLENGSSTLYDRLVRDLNIKDNVRLLASTRVERIVVKDGRVTAVCTPSEQIPCDAAISTVAPQILTRLLPSASGDYFDNLRAIKSIGVVCLLFNLKSAFSPYYWMNVNDTRIKFNGIIEMTNLNRHLAGKGLHLLYIPYYLPTTEPRYQESDQFFYDEYVQSLQILNPSFTDSSIKEWHVFRDPYAQAVCTTNFTELIPQVRSPIRGLYVTDSSQFYPEDRTLSAAIRQGRKAAQIIQEEGG